MAVRAPKALSNVGAVVTSAASRSVGMVEHQTHIALPRLARLTT